MAIINQSLQSLFGTLTSHLLANCILLPWIDFFRRNKEKPTPVAAPQPTLHNPHTDSRQKEDISAAAAAAVVALGYNLLPGRAVTSSLPDSAPDQIDRYHPPRGQ